MVTWQPYEECNPLDTLSKENTLRRSYLISFYIVEYYRPDRVLRQFGKIQVILVGPPQWDRSEKVCWIDELSSEISDWQQ
ncbi:hypothetical protein AMTR_s00036p00199810 [Amborella trichopoda]|uniref:Aminotransferase-like plant mobile domain-containing protein n=1 Tax=Amborella trichopoda TaxID=13333 RepID=U5CQD4_AMBTC|nr:hypothetical protein AMTR_s00036p00199810 [Amborella trichopoda]